MQSPSSHPIPYNYKAKLASKTMTWRAHTHTHTQTSFPVQNPTPPRTKTVPNPKSEIRSTSLPCLKRNDRYSYTYTHQLTVRNARTSTRAGNQTCLELMQRLSRAFSQAIECANQDRAAQRRVLGSRWNRKGKGGGREGGKGKRGMRRIVITFSSSVLVLRRRIGIGMRRDRTG